MFNLLKSSVSVLAQAAKDVADELNQQQSTAPSTASASLNSKQDGDNGQAIRLGKDNGRLVLCGFPDKSLATEVFKEDRSLRPFSSPAVLKRFLSTSFPSNAQFLVWNLSGIKYSYEDLDGNIIEYDFPARPILPFPALVEVANAIQQWLSSSPDNVAVVHDISGRRAAVIAACALELTDYYPKETSLRAVANEMGRAGDALVASQIRYFEYFCISQRKDSSFVPDKKLRLDRIIINGVPDYTFETKLATSRELSFCKPYLKVINAAGEDAYCSDPPDTPVFGRDISFSVVPSTPVIVSGDIMLRFFHSKGGDRTADVPMFAVSFHVGFVTDVVLRFTRTEIDGTAKSPRFPKDMFIDVIFSENLDVSQTVGIVKKSPEKPVIVEPSMDTVEKELNELDLGDVDLANAGDETFDMLSSPSFSRPTSGWSPSKEKAEESSLSPSTIGSQTELLQINVNPSTKHEQSPVAKIPPSKQAESSHSGSSDSSKPIASTPPKASDTVEKPKKQPPISEIKKVEPDEELATTALVPPSPIDLNRGDSVLKEIEAALNEEDFAVEDFDISELDENWSG